MSASSLLAGFGEALLEPRPGTMRSSWGFFTVAPTGHAAPLMVRATVLESAGARAAVITVDACLIEAEVATGIRRRVEEEHRIPAAHVVLQTSHTHQGPYAEEPDDGASRVISEAVLAAVGRAAADTNPVSVSWARKSTKGLSVNRRRPGSYVEQDLTLVRFDGQGRPRAAWFHFAAHPLCGMGYDDRWSADFPGYAADALVAAHPGLHAQYLQGAAGDVAPFDWWFGNQAPTGRTHDDSARKLGRLLGAECETLWTEVAPARADRLIVGHTKIEVPHRTFWFSLAEVEALIAELGPRVAANPPRPWGDRLSVSRSAYSEPEVYMLA